MRQRVIKAPDDLWEAAGAVAKASGISLAELLRQELRQRVIDAMSEPAVWSQLDPQTQAEIARMARRAELLEQLAEEG